MSSVEEVVPPFPEVMNFELTIDKEAPKDEGSDEEPPVLRKRNYFAFLDDEVDVPPSSSDEPFHLDQFSWFLKPKSQLKRKQDGFQLTQMAPVFLSMITEYLSAQDIFQLWLTGDVNLRLLLGAYGGVNTLNMHFDEERNILAPFGFAGCFAKLHHLNLRQMHYYALFYRKLDTYSDLTSLPRTLVSLTITSREVLDLFFNRHELALTVSVDEEMAPSRDSKPLDFIITDYKRPGPDASKIFYNLDELFPNLKILELEVEADDYHGVSTEKAVSFSRRVAQHLPRDYQPKLFLKRSKWDDELEDSVDVEEDSSIEEAFVNALPRSLTKMRLDFECHWHTLMLENLPPSLSDLTLYAIVTVDPETGELDDDSADYDSDEMSVLATTEFMGPVQAKTAEKKWSTPLSEAPMLPDFLTRLTIRRELSLRATSALIERLPAGLQTLIIAGDAVLFKTAHVENLPSELQTLKVRFWNHFDIYRVISYLPRHLTSLSLGCDSYGLDSSAPTKLREISWPITLVRLKMAIHFSAGLEMLFNSLADLHHLDYLYLNYDGQTGGIHSEDSVFPKKMVALPISLRSLILDNTGIHPRDYQFLPKGLTHLEVTSDYSRSGRADLVFDHKVLPPALRKLKIWGRCNSRQSLPNIFALHTPHLESLEIQLIKPHARAQEYDWTSHISPRFSHLTNLRIWTQISPPNSLSSHLPRSLTRLDYRGSTARLLNIAELPRGIRSLHVTLTILSTDFSHLPPSLISLRCRWGKLARKRKGKAKAAPNEALSTASQLPRSLTRLSLSGAHAWDYKAFSNLPPALAAIYKKENATTTSGDVFSIPPRASYKSCWFTDSYF
jgi:hypothetical protein